MMTAYFISGLGADEKIFQRLRLPAGFEYYYINWIEPLNNESFHDYAQRLSQVIGRDKDFILIGVSMGGMMAIEISKFLQPKYTIQISSALNKNGLPLWTRLAGMSGISNLVSEKLLHSDTTHNYNFLGTKSEEDIELAKAMIRNTSITFFRWAVAKIVRWENDYIPTNLVRIHGTNDRIIPFPKEENVVSIENGTHFMVYNRAEEINKILEEKLANIK